MSAKEASAVDVLSASDNKLVIRVVSMLSKKSFISDKQVCVYQIISLSLPMSTARYLPNCSTKSHSLSRWWMAYT